MAGPFLLSSTGFHEALTEEHCLEWITEVFNKYQIAFDFVYILSHRFCIYYKPREDISEKRLLTAEVFKHLSTRARMKAESEFLLADP